MLLDFGFNGAIDEEDGFFIPSPSPSPSLVDVAVVVEEEEEEEEDISIYICNLCEWKYIC